MFITGPNHIQADGLTLKTDRCFFCGAHITGPFSYWSAKDGTVGDPIVLHAACTKRFAQSLAGEWLHAELLETDGDEEERQLHTEQAVRLGQRLGAWLDDQVKTR